VLKFVGNEEKFEIRWKANGRTKLVNRVNLKFTQEESSAFEEKISQSQFNRDQSEVYLRYNVMIEVMSEETSSMPPSMMSRILVRTFCKSTSQLSIRSRGLVLQLVEEVKQLWVYVNHKI